MALTSKKPLEKQKLEHHLRTRFERNWNLGIESLAIPPYQLHSIKILTYNLSRRLDRVCN
jgi:hypothetical protein